MSTRFGVTVAAEGERGMGQEGLRGIAFDVPGRLRRHGREGMIAELRRYGRSARRPYTTKGFEAFGSRVSLSTIVTRFGTFRAACDAAGLDTSDMYRGTYTDEALLAAFEGVCRERVARRLPAVPTNWQRYRAAGARGLALETLTRRFGPYSDFLMAYDQYHKGELSRARLLVQLSERQARPGRRKLSPRLRAETLKRFDHRCTACGRGALDLAPRERLEVDHLTPVALGGGDDPDNLTVRCTPCNRGKGARFVG